MHRSRERQKEAYQLGKDLESIYPEGVVEYNPFGVNAIGPGMFHPAARLKDGHRNMAYCRAACDAGTMPPEVASPAVAPRVALLPGSFLEGSPRLGMEDA